MEALHESVTVRVVPAHETARLTLPGMVGLVVSRMIDRLASDEYVPEVPFRTRAEMVFVPSPLSSVHARFGLEEE